ncbi:helix-turn-helix domain-containing protein [Clostridium botulinum]|uniref:helix-turn-helix domain-containing protein n=1 Tax=Clostridium botulinum TaxID=1491 RepID=UPI00249F246B|nr:helix-turn-helix transcriptional regulator [Clostridium botulinum]MDU4596500.1 helix-turn-helix transcriptional regulator [Clostridium sporogenes]WGZ48130.1 helix-turn-helix transcriptional regulator [Clostridium botulinum]
MATLGERIKEERLARKMTQTDLGNICGVTKYTISLYESGKSTPNDDIKNILANYFKVSIDYLLGRTDIKTTYETASSSKSDYDPDLNSKDKRDIEQMTNKFLEGLEGGAMLNGEILDESDLELFKQAVKNGLQYAKISNKKKYTPKKYRK